MSGAFLRVLALSAALKLALAFTFADLPPRYDETEYLEFGRHILEEGAPPVLWRAPGYPAFVAAGLGIAGGRPVGVRLLQVLVSIAASVLVYRLARTRWGERAALPAGAFSAFFPSDVAFSHLLWSEVLYGTLALGAFDRLLAARDRGSTRAAAFAGLLLGAATLTRSTGAVLAVVSIVWCLAGGAARLRRAAACAFVWAAVVGSWSASASARAGRFVFVDTNSGFNLWSGNSTTIPPDLASLWCVGLPLENGGMPAGPLGSLLPGSGWRERVRFEMAREGILDAEGPAGDAWYRREALAAMRADPGRVVERIPQKLGAFWAPDYFLPRHVVRDWYGPAPPLLAGALLALTWACAALPLLGGPAALAVLRAGAFRSLAAAWVLGVAALHAIVYGHSRTHAPLVPLLVLAVFGALAEAPAAGRWMRRGAPAFALALALWVAALPAVVGVYLGPGPRHAELARAIGAVRHLPLPGARWVAWMQSGVEETLGRRGEAGRILDDPRWAEDPWTHFLRARLAMARSAADPSAPAPRDWEAALPDLERAAALDPSSEAITFALTAALRESGRTEEAAALSERARAARVRSIP